MAAARRGAEVVAIDLSASLIEVAKERLPTDLGDGRIDLRVGDMLDEELGRFDYVVAMDSLIHYRTHDMVNMIARLCERADHGVVVTFAPRTALLTLMHLVGRLFPRGDRAPAIEPIRESDAAASDRQTPGSRAVGASRERRRIASGFYTSQTMELARGEP